MIKGLPERLREQRIKNDLSQKSVAETIGVSQSIIAGYESGYRTPSTEILLSLAYLYKCSTDYLLGKEKNSNLLLLDVTGLSSEQIESIHRLVDSIKK